MKKLFVSITIFLITLMGLSVTVNAESYYGVTGQITDAVTGQGIPNVSYVLKNTSGEILDTGIFEYDYVEFILPKGDYVLGLSKNGYISAQINITVKTAPITDADVVLSQEATSAVASGQCGDDATWTLDSDGVLTISGSGAMYDYSPYRFNYAPWNNNRDLIKLPFLGFRISISCRCSRIFRCFWTELRPTLVLSRIFP